MNLEYSDQPRGRATEAALRCVLLLLIGASIPGGSVARAADGVSALQPRQISPGDLKPRSEWRNVGRTTPEAWFETSRWADAEKNIDVVLETILIDDDARAKAQQALERLPAEERQRFGTADRFIATLLTRRTAMTGIKMLGLVQNPNRPNDVGLHTLWQYEDGRIRENKNIVVRLTPDGWRQPINARYIEPLLQTRLKDERRGPGIVSGVLRPNPAGTEPARLAPGLVALDALQNRGNATALATLETIFWAKGRRDFAALEKLIVVTPEARTKAQAKLAALSDDGRARMPEVTSPERMVLQDWLTSTRETGIQVDTETALAPDRAYLSGHRQDTLGVSNFDLVLRRTDGGWKWYMSDTWGPSGFAGLVRPPTTAR